MEFHLRLLDTRYIHLVLWDVSAHQLQKWLVSHTTSLIWKRQRKKKKTTRWIFMAECRFIPPLTESNATYALFAWADLWFIGTSVTYEVFRCLHDPLLANLCFRVKIQKWASITSAAGSIKTRVLVKCRFLKCCALISKLLGVMLRSIQRQMWDPFHFSRVLWSDSQWHKIT